MEECGICFENNWILKTPCKHIICLECLLKLQKDECPYCRKLLFNKLPLAIQQIININYSKKKKGLNINDYIEFPSLT